MAKRIKEKKYCFPLIQDVAARNIPYAEILSHSGSEIINFPHELQQYTLPKIF